MAPMQEDPGVCIHHSSLMDLVKEACTGIKRIETHLVGTLENPGGMLAEHKQLMEDRADGKSKRRFVWEHLIGYILTAGLTAVGTIFIGKHI